MLFDMIFNQSFVRLRTLPALLAGFVVLSSVAIAQSQFWGPTNGPFGGIVKAVVFDAQVNLYAGTAGSGVFRSTDNGDTWTMINNGLDNHHISTDHLIRGLAASPGGDLVASVPGTVYYSTDGGDSWNESTGISWGIEFLSLANARDGSFIGGATQGPIGGIFRSTDRGATWERTGLEGQGISSLVVTRQGSILAGRTAAKGIERSTDHGATWQPTSLTDMQVHHMVVDSSGGITTSVIEGQYAQSSNDGFTWYKIKRDDFWRLTTMAVAPNGNIYNSTANGLFMKSGWEAEWAEISSEPFARNAACMTFAPNGDLFLASSMDGIYRYRPSSGEWKEVNRGLTNRGGNLIAHPNGAVYAAGYQGIAYFTKDKGKTWDRSTTIDRVPIAIYPTGEIVTESHTSRDGGSTWEPIYLPSGYRGSTLIGPQGKLYIADNQNLYVSSDTGKSWISILGATNFISAMVVDRKGAIVVGVDSLGSIGVERSTDGGTTWSLRPISEKVTVLAADSTGNLVAATDRGIYRSTDDGDTWNLTAAPVIPFTSLVVSHGGEIYAGSSNQGVYRSTDNGVTWAELNGGLEYRMIISLAVDYDNYIYAGTQSGGVFVSNGPSSDTEWKAALSDGLALRSHPNPFAETTGIRFSLPHAAHVSLVITNTLGQPVAVLAEEEMEQGDQAIAWNPAGLPHGFYFCTLKTGERIEVMRVVYR